MILQKDFINKLRDFGLNTYEGKLWAALLSRGISTAGELSDIANVPRSRSYDVLESLEKKGFIVMKIGKPIKYLAVPPSEVLERVKKKISKEAEKNIELLENIHGSKILEELNLLHTQGIDIVDPADLSGCMRSRSANYNHLESLFKGAQKSIVIVTSTEGIVRKAESFLPSLTKAKKNGVSIRIAATLNKAIVGGVLQHLLRVADVRHSQLQGRFAIVDNKEVVFMVSDDKNIHPSYDAGIWVTTPYFAQALSSLFDKEWKNMPTASKLLK